MPAPFTVRLAFFYAAIFLIMGVHLPYFPVWLEARGLNEFEISIVIAAPLLLRIFITPAIAVYTDHDQRHRLTIIILALGTVAATLWLSQLSTFFAILPASILLTVCAATILPLTETLAAIGSKQSSLDYGRMRLWGSLTFIGASFATGALLSNREPQIIIWLIAAGAFTTLLAAFALPQSGGGRMRREHPGKAASLGAAKALVQSRVFLLFLLAAGCAHASHATYYAFATLQWLDQGISPVTISALWAVGIFAEIVLFAFSGRVVNWISPLHLLCLGAGACAVRWAVMCFAPPLALLWPIQCLHALTYGATHLGAFHFISRAVPDTSATTAQALYATIGTGGALGAATLLSGMLVPALGVKAYWAMAGLGLLGLSITLVAANRWDGAYLVSSAPEDRHAGR